MNIQPDYINDKKAAAAFSNQAAFFDELYSSNEMIRYKRLRVRDHLLKYLKTGSHILELNAGTGEDAVFLAGRGHRVHATDISAGMLDRLNQKVSEAGLGGLISSECCSFNALEDLQLKGPYDCLFSNFAGLNCTGELRKVLESFEGLLKPDGIVVLVVLPTFSLWETLLVFRGKFKTAFRRFFSSQGRKAKIGQEIFTCWYYNPRYIRNILKKDFSFLELEGLCTVVPPSYIEFFPEKYPKTYSWLCRMEKRLRNKWPWRSIGDYYILSLLKK